MTWSETACRHEISIQRSPFIVDEFERLAAAFAVGDKVVIEGLKAKPKYNGKAAVVRGRVNARGRFPVTVEMRDGPETIALKLANLRAADE